MGNRESQVFGCFLGILGAVFISLPLYSFINLPIWLEYFIVFALALLFSVIGTGLVRALTKPKLPVQNRSPQEVPPNQNIQSVPPQQSEVK